MARKADETRLRAAKEAITTQPGQSASFYAQLLGCHRYVFSTVLAMLNEREFLLWEDERGGLWPFGTQEE
ncbi:MAG: hypothetical protein ACE5GO_02225 [Anaerolineales bacterium]